MYAYYYVYDVLPTNIKSGHPLIFYMGVLQNSKKGAHGIRKMGNA